MAVSDLSLLKGLVGSIARTIGRLLGRESGSVGMQLFRVFDDVNAFKYGKSWTPVDPRTVTNYKEAAGLFDNAGTIMA